MKEFLKYTLATVVGIIVFGIVSGFLFVICMIGIVASGDSKTTVKDNSVMVINLTGTLSERAEENLNLPAMVLSGNMSSDGQLGLNDLLLSIKKAKENENVKGIYLEAGAFAADSYASLQALRRELEAFKKSGKWIVAYGDTYTQESYYLCSVSSKVYLNPQGIIDWHGLADQPIFYKDLMAKFGVKMQLAKVGTYKSAPETFTADKMSDANREQVTAYVTGIWNTITKEVAASRGVSVEKLNQYADSLITFSDPKEYITMKMADKLIYTDEVKSEIKKLLKIEEDERVKQISYKAMLNTIDDVSDGEQIAVYYAQGNIVDGGAQSLTSNGPVIDAQVVCRDIERLMNDDDVKAVVLRINSGGGSAYASEQIWHQLKKLKEKKPVVVSMGGMAASGGYYIAAPANWIISEPTTLTGSIGIFGMFPDFSGLLTEKLGVKFDEVSTNKHSVFGSMARPFNDEEMAILDKHINRGYKLFRSRVAEGRKMTEDQVEAVAQGHVFLGQDALKTKLVDELGGIDKAIEKAAKLAKLEEYYTSEYPGTKSFIEQLTSSMDEGASGNYLDGQLKLTLGELYEPLMLMKNMAHTNPIQARIPFCMNVR